MRRARGRRCRRAARVQLASCVRRARRPRASSEAGSAKKPTSRRLIWHQLRVTLALNAFGLSRPRPTQARDVSGAAHARACGVRPPVRVAVELELAVQVQSDTMREASTSYLEVPAGLACEPVRARHWPARIAPIEPIERALWQAT